MKRQGAWVLLVLPLFLGLLPGCPWSPEKTVKPPDVVSKYLAQSSPGNVMENLRTAYMERNLDEYKKLFAADFTFVFAPADATDPDNPTPTQWSGAEEFTSTENMFRDDLVEKIELEYGSLGVAEPDSANWGAGAWKMKIDGVNLAVRTRNEQNEPLTYLVPGTTEVFFFREDKNTPASDGRPTWFIFRWEDQPIGAHKTETNSWGQVKNHYK